MSFKSIDNITASNHNNTPKETVMTLINLELDSELGKRFQYATINYDEFRLSRKNRSRY